MFKNHYIKSRRRAGPEDRLGSALESIILQVVPLDHLVTVDEIFRLAEMRCKIEGEKPPTLKSCENIVNELVRRGFVCCLNTRQIEKALAGF